MASPAEIDVEDVTALRAFVDGRDWYHTIDLGRGIITPGWFDTRTFVQRLPFPERLDGQRCLDVGTFDGFWAFEMEARGADEVIATDVLNPEEWDWPPGTLDATRRQVAERHQGGVGFDVVSRALGSRVQRRACSVYDLDPQTHGQFDFVYLGSLLLHLRDPVGALDRVRGVCRGQLLVVDTIDLPLTLRSPRRPLARLDGRGRPWWWTPNAAGLVRMVEAAGFEVVGRPQQVAVPSGTGQHRPRLRPRVLRTAAGRQALLRAHHGDPHLVIVARPVA